MPFRELIRIAYCSKARAPTDDLLVLSTILGISHRNNMRDHITGALAASGGRFFQVAEGPNLAVRALMARIRQDPRHTDIEVVEDQQIKDRLFGDWLMAAPRITPELAPQIDRAVDNCHSDPGQAIDLLREIVRRQNDLADIPLNVGPDPR